LRWGSLKIPGRSMKGNAIPLSMETVMFNWGTVKKLNGVLKKIQKGNGATGSNGPEDRGKRSNTNAKGKCRRKAVRP